MLLHLDATVFLCYDAIMNSGKLVITAGGCKEYRRWYVDADGVYHVLSRKQLRMSDLIDTNRSLGFSSLLGLPYETLRQYRDAVRNS